MMKNTSLPILGLFMMLLFQSLETNAAENASGGKPLMYGSYLPERVGKELDVKERRLIYKPDRELLYDFDAPDALGKVTASGGDVEVSPEYYMSDCNSLLWRSQAGGSLSFQTGGFVLRPGERGESFIYAYSFSVGLFLKEQPKDDPVPTFRLELLSPEGKTLYEIQIYLHRTGWNMSAVDPALPLGTKIGSIRLVSLNKGPVSVCLDNLMIHYAYSNPTRGIYQPVVYYESHVLSEKNEASPEELLAFQTITDRIIQPPSPLKRIPDEKMKELEDWFSYWKVDTKGEFANGLLPYIFQSSVPGNKGTWITYTNPMYRDNQNLCANMKQFGSYWAACQDPEQKARLRKMFVGLVRLAVTYGCIPSPWYNGRGFAEGVFYGRDALKEEGLLEPVSRLIIMQYWVDQILQQPSPLAWSNPPGFAKAQEAGKTPVNWPNSADSLLTGSKSLILSLLIYPKAANFHKISEYYSNVAFDYAPSTHGVFKPDGCVFHHWGNRVEDYGMGGFSGACEVLWWLSGTPFRVLQPGHERLLHVADVYRKITLADGSLGTPDNRRNEDQSERGGYQVHASFLNLARSGMPDGSSDIMPEMASAYLALNGSSFHKEHKEDFDRFVQAGIKPALPPDSIATMNYAGIQIRRKQDWVLYLWGLSKKAYHTEYVRKGFLFYNIGSLELVEEGRLHAMWSKRGVWLKQVTSGMTPGYHPSYAPCVTALEADWSKLEQANYQNGSDEFVGGVSMEKPYAVFVQNYRAPDVQNTRQTVAGKLSFRKAYFTFDQTVVALGRDISSQGLKLFTGVLQERSSDTAPGIIWGSDGKSCKELGKGMDSAAVSWASTHENNLGAWFFPGQRVCGADGILEAGSTSGEFARLWLDHGECSDGSYGLIYKVRPQAGEMAEFAKRMTGQEPPIRIVCDTPKLLAVSESLNGVVTTGCIFYQNTDATGTGPLLAADAPCLVVTRLPADGNRLSLAVADPVLRNSPDKSNPFGYSQPVTVRLTLDRKWSLKETKKTMGVPVPTVKVTSSDDGKTFVEIECRNGLTTEMTLSSSNG